MGRPIRFAAQAFLSISRIAKLTAGLSSSNLGSTSVPPMSAAQQLHKAIKAHEHGYLSPTSHAKISEKIRMALGLVVRIRKLTQRFFLANL
jgi:hypothetical protein